MYYPPNKLTPRKTIQMTEQQKKEEYMIYTDGSGAIDGFGGAGAIITRAIDYTYAVHMLASTGCNAPRGEAIAVLVGLNGLRQLLGIAETIQKIKNTKKPFVCIVTDNEAVADMINQTAVPKKNLDVWSAIQQASRYFHVRAEHTRRDTIEAQKTADMIASKLRNVIRGFYESHEEVNLI